jgi:hypothetical protein
MAAAWDREETTMDKQHDPLPHEPVAYGLERRPILYVRLANGQTIIVKPRARS